MEAKRIIALPVAVEPSTTASSTGSPTRANPKAKPTAKIIRLLVQPKLVIQRKQQLLVYQDVTTQRRHTLESEFEGELSEWKVKEGDVVAAGQPLAFLLEPCSHPVNFGGLCGVCGKDLTRTDSSGMREDSRVDIMIAHENAMLFVSKEEASRIEHENARRLVQQRKLSLILDLDQTVIHATVNPAVEKYVNDSRFKDHPAIKDIHRFTLPEGAYYVKLRPGLKAFLEETCKLYEFHIYTMGTRNYANKVSKMIDPEGSIFIDRVLSRDESGSMTQKTIRRLFPCDDSMVVALDDRADVWQWSQNLIKVRPYHFFTGTGDINAPPKSNGQTSEKMEQQLPPPPVEEVILDECLLTTAAQAELASEEEDGHDDSGDRHSPTHEQLIKNAPFPMVESDQELNTLTRVLKDLHAKFYASLDKKRESDVKAILPKMKREVLKGIHISFSSIIPIGQTPENSEIWLLATAFGATCHKTISPEITHLVAAKTGTDKVRLAKSMQSSADHPIWIVRPEWLYDSFSHWEKQPEEPFFLEHALFTSPLVPGGSSGKSYAPRTPSPKASSSLDWDDNNLHSDLRMMNRSEISDLNREIEDELGLDQLSSEEEQLYEEDLAEPLDYDGDEVREDRSAAVAMEETSRATVARKTSPRRTSPHRSPPSRKRELRSKESDMESDANSLKPKRKKKSRKDQRSVRASSQHGNSSSSSEMNDSDMEALERELSLEEDF